jgi:hypothetical protein
VEAEGGDPSMRGVENQRRVVAAISAYLDAQNGIKEQRLNDFSPEVGRYQAAYAEQQNAAAQGEGLQYVTNSAVAAIFSGVASQFTADPHTISAISGFGAAEEGVWGAVAATYGAVGATSRARLPVGGGGRAAPFNPTGSRTNCVNSVCAFLKSVQEKSLVTASDRVAWNGGSIDVANAQIKAQTGVRIGEGQRSELRTGYDRQFFIVYPGSSRSSAQHVLIGINNSGRTFLYDPQTGARIANIASFGAFVASP